MLIHFFPMHLFLRFSDVFRGAEEGCIGNKWVNIKLQIFQNLTTLILQIFLQNRWIVYSKKDFIINLQKYWNKTTQTTKVIVTFTDTFKTLSISKMERFAKIFSGLRPFTIFAKCLILDIWYSSEYTSEFENPKDLIIWYDIIISFSFSSWHLTIN